MRRRDREVRPGCQWVRRDETPRRVVVAAGDAEGAAEGIRGRR